MGLACPSDDVLAAFVEQPLDRTDAVEGHLDSCTHCRALVGHLAALGAAQRQAAKNLDLSSPVSIAMTDERT